MSHFTVLVVANDEEHLEQVMQPYHEYECTGIEDEYVIWVDDIHDENLHEFETETVPVVLKNGKPIGTKYDRTDEIQVMWDRSDKIGFSSKDEFVPAPGYELVEMPKKEYFADFDTYMEQWCGYTEKRNGRYGRMTNPNAQWDWWLVGGRWTGFLKLKPNAELYTTNKGNGTPGVMTDPNTDPTRCDLAPAGDIDWQAMAQEWHSEQLAWWDKCSGFMAQAFEQENIPQDVIDRAEELWNDNNKRGELARETFGSIIKAIKYEYANHLANEAGDHWFHSWEQIGKLMLSREKFLQTLGTPPAQTFAFIDQEGHWNQRGQMGWFGVSNKEKSTPDYDKAWWEFVTTLPKSQMVFVVDCHI